MGAGESRQVQRGDMDSMTREPTKQTSMMAYNRGAGGELAKHRLGRHPHSLRDSTPPPPGSVQCRPTAPAKLHGGRRVLSARTQVQIAARERCLGGQRGVAKSMTGHTSLSAAHPRIQAEIEAEIDKLRQGALCVFSALQNRSWISTWKSKKIATTRAKKLALTYINTVSTCIDNTQSA